MKKVFILILIIFSFNLMGCGYIDYVSKGEDISELVDAKKQFIEKIDEYISALEFYDAEQDKCTNYTIEYKAQINESKDINDLQTIYNTFVKVIDDLLTKDEQDKIDFENYRDKKINELKSHVILEEYREAEQLLIKELQNEFITKLNSSITKNEVDALLVDYKIKVYSFEKENYYVEQELLSLKETTIKGINDLFVETNYYEYEQKLIKNLIESNTLLINAAKTIVEVQSIYDSYKLLLSGYKTIDDYYKEEVLKLIDNSIIDIKNMVGYDNLSTAEKANMDTLFATKKDEFIKINNIELIKKEVIVLKKNIIEEEAKKENPIVLPQYNQLIIDDLKIYNNSLIYRNEQLIEISIILNEYEKIISSSMNYNTTVGLFNEAKTRLDNIKTNDDLWTEEYNNFITERNNLYGTDVLIEPYSLIEAANYQQLADIMDYYAFYQIDSTKFLCNKFRVKFNAEGKTALYVRNEVYWYAELLNGSVGINAYFDINKDYIVFEYIPYAMASISNKSTYPISNLLQNYNSNSKDIRDVNFTNFPYLNNQNKVIVNNSQQLWYALEHKYQPIALPGSSAEKVLNRAKEILIKIIKNDMTDEEKIYQIINWLSSNVSYAGFAFRYNNSSNMDMYPAENFSKLNCLYPEGALFDGNAICSGYARTCSLLLGIEGVSFRRVITRSHLLRGKNTINSRDYGGGGFGFHEFLYVNINNKWYYSDPGFCVFDHKSQSNIYMLSSLSAQEYGFTVQFSDIIVENDLYIEFYKNIYSYGQSIFKPLNYKLLLDSYVNDVSRGRLSIIVNNNNFTSLKDEILKIVGLNYDVRHIPYKDGRYSEVIIFKE